MFRRLFWLGVCPSPLTPLCNTPSGTLPSGHSWFSLPSDNLTSPSPELFYFGNVLICEPKQVIACSIMEQIWSHATRELFSWIQDSRVITHTRWKYWDMKGDYEPFISRWDETLIWFNICLHGVNSDRVGRSAELLSVLFTRSYFTLSAPWPR